MEPISIAAGALGAKFLEEAIKFLWSEAGKILDRYHQRVEQKRAASEPIVVDDEAPARLQLPKRRVVNVPLLEKRKKEILAAMRDLSGYAHGHEKVSVSDAELLRGADALQRLIVEVYDIDAPELGIASTVHVVHVKEGGKVTGVDAANLTSGKVVSDVTVGTAEGDVTGVKIDNR